MLSWPAEHAFAPDEDDSSRELGGGIGVSKLMWCIALLLSDGATSALKYLVQVQC